MRALLEELDYSPGEAVLLYRCSGEQDILFRAELDQLADRRGVVVHYLTGPRRARRSWLSASVPGHVDDAQALRRLAPALLAADVFICGPDGWMDAAEAAVRAAGVPREQVHAERFSW
jgi:ferredoxin-NADP reductase